MQPSSSSAVPRSPSVHFSDNVDRRNSAAKKGRVDSTIVELATLSEQRSLSPSKNRRDSSRIPRTVKAAEAALPNYYDWLQKRATRYPAWRKTKALYQRGRKFVLRINDIPPTKDGRHIRLELPRLQALTDERTSKPYVSNTILSCRYNLWNFLPRQLVAQFSKVANFYFLVVSIFQMIPGLSTTGTYTTIVPVIIFVTISMFKEGYDDYRRYRLDKVENNRQVSVLDATKATPEGMPKDRDYSGSPVRSPVDTDESDWIETKWHCLQVGDVVRLKRDDPVPADLVLLTSTGANQVASIETMALDGETNLKAKTVPHCLAKRYTTPNDIRGCQAEFVVEDPNINLYKLDGSIMFEGQRTALSNNEIIYRGSVLRNTTVAYGMVIYTGEECKIRMNANSSIRIKAPSIQAKVNKIVVIIVIFVIALAIFNTVAYQVWRAQVESDSWYLINSMVPFFPILISFVIMFNTLIPLSLYVSQEIIKVAQMVLLNDIDMYDEKSDTPFEARTSTINEELGQISYIFSDKTGTLTNNEMRFRKMSVAGLAWLHDTDLVWHDAEKTSKPTGRKSKGKRPMGKLSISSPTVESHNPLDEFPVASAPRPSISQWHSSALPDRAQSDLSTTLMVRYLQWRPHTTFAKRARLFLLSMALCHTCLPETRDDGEIEFQASSPDELAILKAAQELDYLVIDKDAKTLSLKTFPSGRDAESVIEKYEIVDVIEFSSKRKRMSVIVRFPDGRMCLFCKGADSVLMERLRLARIATAEHDELERKDNMRKSMEAQEVIRRRSEHRDRTSMSRSSFQQKRMAHGRRSLGGLLPSNTAKSPQDIRNDLDGWLHEHEHDVFVPSSAVEVPIPKTPRPSLGMSFTSYDRTMAARYSLDAGPAQIDQDFVAAVERELVTSDSAIVERCFQHINDFATDGLRTLVYGHRFLTEEEYVGWQKEYTDASTATRNRQAMVERTAELIECNLELGGAIAIEDKLQHGVPETIDKLRRANIKMWMLTGDKRETAINIGHTCRLIKDYSSTFILDHALGRIEQRIAEAALEVQGGNEAHSVIIVDGQTLTIIEEETTTRKLFLDLAIAADSVICCRASPSQKAHLVRAVRRRVKGAVTLAIGDGANDIAMIQEAHVGIGITGKEGLQAARSSDYSIAQFRFLTKLLLVHGRWNYVRISKYTVTTFWKEMVFYMVQALYQRFAGYTGTSLYENWSLSMFNTLFTSLCVIVIGIFEQDLKAATLLAVPELYNYGQKCRGFNFKVFLWWIFMAVCEAVIIFHVAYALYGDAIINDSDLFALGNLAFTACIILININIQLIEMHYKSILTAGAVIITIGGWFLWNIVLSASYKDTLYRVKDSFFTGFGNDLLWWAVLGLCLVCTLFFEMCVRSLTASYFPSDVDTFQRLETDASIRRRFEEASVMELQQGWKARTETLSTRKSRKMQQAADEAARREEEVREILDRPRVMNAAGHTPARPSMTGQAKTSSTVNEREVD